MKRKSEKKPVTRKALLIAQGECDRPDINGLFQHLNRLYFESKLEVCSVKWSSQRTRYRGRCIFEDGGCEIRLSEPLLKTRNWGALRGTLLHEMIHAYLFLAASNEDHRNHGADFRIKMDEVCEFQGKDEERPYEGYAAELRRSRKFCIQAAADETASSRTRNRSNKRFRTRVVDVCASCAGLQRKQLEPPPVSKALVQVPVVPTEEPRTNAESTPKKRKLLHVEDIKTSKAPRLEKARNQEAAGRAGKLAQRKPVVEHRPPSPNVMISSLNWAAYEPEEEEGDKLIDRRWQRKQEERARKAVMTLAEECSKLECEDHIAAGALVVYSGSSSDKKTDNAAQHVDEPCVEAYAGYETFDLASVEETALVLYESPKASTRTMVLYEPPKASTRAMVLYEPTKAATDREVKCFERRRKEVARPVTLADVNPRGVAKAKVKAKEQGTRCPVCNKLFGFDLVNPHDNAKFNTHVDECLNQGFA